MDPRHGSSHKRLINLKLLEEPLMYAQHISKGRKETFVDPEKSKIKIIEEAVYFSGHVAWLKNDTYSHTIIR